MMECRLTFRLVEGEGKRALMTLCPRETIHLLAIPSELDLHLKNKRLGLAKINWCFFSRTFMLVISHKDAVRWRDN